MWDWLKPLVGMAKPSVEQTRRHSQGLERLFCHYYDQLAGCGRVVFLARFSGPYDAAGVERALQIVTAACPNASLQVVRLPAGDYVFEPRERYEPPPISVYPVSDADEGAQLAAEIGAEAFAAGTEPSLHWAVLPADDGTFQIVGRAHHGLFDGASMAILIRRFLQVLGSESIPNWEWPEPEIPRARWRTAFQHWAFLWRHRTQILRSLRKTLTVRQELPKTETCVVHRWTQEETDRLIQACRQSQTTVTSLLGVVGAFSLKALYGEQLPVVSMTIPINLRRYLPTVIAEATIGMRISFIIDVIDFRQPVSLTEQSKQLAQGLQEFLQCEGPLRGHEVTNRFLPRKIQLKRTAPVGVSSNSLGRMEKTVSPSGVRWLEAGWFGHGGKAMPALSQTAATIDHRLAITSYSNWLSREHVQELAADVDARLRRFAGLDSAAADDRVLPALIAASAH